MIHDTYLILHNIRSAYNVGSIFRTADAAGVKKVYLTGYTPGPVDRFGRKRNSIQKVALGAEETVEWEEGRIYEVIEKLKEDDVEIVAVEQDKRSILFSDFKQRGSTAFIFGNEVGGIEEEICGACSRILEIPMKGKKESLNVSVAVGIILFGLAR